MFDPPSFLGTEWHLCRETGSVTHCAGTDWALVFTAAEGYRVRKSPRGGFRKPRRHSSWCISLERCSLVPSTSLASAPDRQPIQTCGRFWKNNLATKEGCDNKVSRDVHSPSQHSWSRCRYPWLIRSHRFWRVCLWSPRHFELPGLDGYTANRK